MGQSRVQKPAQGLMLHLSCKCRIIMRATAVHEPEGEVSLHYKPAPCHHTVCFTHRRFVQTSCYLKHKACFRGGGLPRPVTHAVQVRDAQLVQVGHNAAPTVGAAEIVSRRFADVREVRGLHNGGVRDTERERQTDTERERERERVRMDVVKVARSRSVRERLRETERMSVV